MKWKDLGLASTTEEIKKRKYEESHKIEIDPQTKTPATRPLVDGSIIFYLYRGKYRIGIYKEINIPLALHTAGDNLVKLVDGTKSKVVDVKFIRAIGGKEIDFNEQQPIKQDLKSEILKYCFSKQDTFLPTDKIIHFTEEELKTGTYTFDLVGTK